MQANVRIFLIQVLLNADNNNNISRKSKGGCTRIGLTALFTPEDPVAWCSVDHNAAKTEDN